MGLLDDLRAIEHFPPSHLPSVSEVLELVGKLIAHAEHGEKLLQAVEKDRQARDAGEPASNVDELLSPPEEEPAPPVPAAGGPAVAGAPAPDDRDARIAQLEQELQTARAQQERTQVEVNPPSGPPPGPTPAAGW